MQHVLMSQVDQLVQPLLLLEAVVFELYLLWYVMVVLLLYPLLEASLLLHLMLVLSSSLGADVGYKSLFLFLVLHLVQPSSSYSFVNKA